MFPDLPKYGFYWNHPNYKKMGKSWSAVYILRYPLSKKIFYFTVYILNSRLVDIV